MPLSRSEQARINGAKSRGPKTAEGKSRSALNAVKHGRYAVNAIVLSNEDAEAFEELIAAYVRRVQPRDQVEYRLTRDLAAIDWRLVRNCALQTRLLDREMDIQSSALDASGLSPAELTRLLDASRATVERSSYPSHLVRYEAHLRRARQAAVTFLLNLRKHFPQSEDNPEIIPPQPLNPEWPLPNGPETDPLGVPEPLRADSESGPSASLAPTGSATATHVILSDSIISSEAIEPEGFKRKTGHRNEPKTNPAGSPRRRQGVPAARVANSRLQIGPGAPDPTVLLHAGSRE